VAQKEQPSSTLKIPFWQQSAGSIPVCGTNQLGNYLSYCILENTFANISQPYKIELHPYNPIWDVILVQEMVQQGYVMG